LIKIVISYIISLLIRRLSMARLPDPFTHPGVALGFQKATLIDNDPIVRDTLPNGKVNEVKMESQYWGLSISYPDMYESEFSFLDAFILEYKRTGGYIDVLLPQYEKFRVSGNISQTKVQSGLAGSTIVLTNIGGLTGLPKPGDLFQLSPYPKVYKITSISTSSSAWTINVYPDLANITNGSEIPVFNGILFRTKLMNGDSFQSDLSVDGMYAGIGLELRESL
jgi:hypothetical protein